MHYCHSDLDEDLDADPFFEYNKCHMCSMLEKKCEDKMYNFDPVRIESSYGLPRPNFEPPKQNITQEIEQVTRQKFYKVMEKLVLPEKCIDSVEENLFKDYQTISLKLHDFNQAAEYMNIL